MGQNVRYVLDKLVLERSEASALYTSSLVVPIIIMTDHSSRESTAWTSRGHHKSGPHAHRAITGDHEFQGGQGLVVSPHCILFIFPWRCFTQGGHHALRVVRGNHQALGCQGIPGAARCSPVMLSAAKHLAAHRASPFAEFTLSGANVLRACPERSEGVTRRAIPFNDVQSLLLCPAALAPMES